MKINKSHLIQQDNATNQQIISLAGMSLNEFNYGLLPIWPPDARPMEVKIIVDAQKSLRVAVYACRAVTPGGIRIETDESGVARDFLVDLPEYTSSLKEQQRKEFYVCLSADVYNRVPAGDVVETEDPPRFPFAVPALSLGLIAADQLANGSVSLDSILIGKVILGRDDTEVVAGYIPPCAAIRSHPALISYHSKYEQFLGNLETCLVTIIKNVRDKKLETSLAMLVSRLCFKMLDYIGPLAVRARWDLINLPPIRLFESLSCLSRIMANEINSNTAADMEEMINYFTSWSELKQGDFEKLLAYTTNFEYNHNEILASLEQFETFMRITGGLFDKLADLAYLGKKKETGIFVKENKTSRSFLAD